MKRSWTMLLAVSVALVIALPAGAVKPPPKPPKPPTSAPIAATLNADLYWVHEAGDRIWYDVTVQNKTRSPIKATIVHPGGLELVTISEPRGVAEFPHLFSYEVKNEDVVPDSDIVGTVTVTYDGGAVVAETSTEMDPVAECIFEDEYGDPAVTKSGLCIWKPPSTGTWEVSAVPDPEPTRPTRAMMTMRDGVPGNWCTLTNDPEFPDNGGIVQDRLKGSEPIVLDVNLPSNGVCLTGGAGVCFDDDCYFAVGNPGSFYLYTTFDATITLTSADDA